MRNKTKYTPNVADVDLDDGLEEWLERRRDEEIQSFYDRAEEEDQLREEAALYADADGESVFKADDDEEEDSEEVDPDECTLWGHPCKKLGPLGGCAYLLADADWLS